MFSHENEHDLRLISMKIIMESYEISEINKLMHGFQSSFKRSCSMLVMLLIRIAARACQNYVALLWTYETAYIELLTSENTGGTSVRFYGLWIM